VQKSFVVWKWDWLIRRTNLQNSSLTLVDFLQGLCRSTCSCSGINFADCCMHELELRVCKNCKSIQNNVHEPFGKKCQHLLSMFANVYYFFRITNAFINIYYYFWPLTHPTVCSVSSVCSFPFFFSFRISSSSVAEIDQPRNYVHYPKYRGDIHKSC